MSVYQLRELKIEVTQQCPLNCLHCSTESAIDKTTCLSEAMVDSLITDARGLGASDIAFSGGEPLVWQGIARAIRNVTRHGMRPTVYTTGLPLLSEGGLADGLADAGVDEVIFSVYGPASAHELVTRVSGSYQLTLDAIKMIAATGVKPAIHFVVLRSNYRLLPEVVKVAESLGVRKLSLLRFVPHGRGALTDTIHHLSGDDLFEFRDIVTNLRQHSDLVIRLGSPFNFIALSEPTKCEAGIARLIVSPDGRIYPCDAFKGILCQGDHGSVHTSSLAQIWAESAYLREVRSAIEAGVGNECEFCNNAQKCSGGCLAQKVIRRVPTSAPDPDCIRRFLGA